MKLNRRILHLAIPSIFTNITIPILGLIDYGISGHLDDLMFIGAIAIGTMIFNMIYWNFGFLRMGTTGLTAQAFGANDKKAVSATLYRALTIAISSGVVIWILQVPLFMLGEEVFEPSKEVVAAARIYFNIRIWSAPVFLSLQVVKGWLLGLQNAVYPMVIALSVNILNILLSVVAVFVLHLGFTGIAIGTLMAEVAGFIIAASLALHKYRGYLVKIPLHELFSSGIGRFFRVNGYIFFRSFFLLAVNVGFTAIGSRAGDLTLATNALIMQLYFFYSYFLDGFAFAAEAIVGETAGAQNVLLMRRSVRRIFLWGVGVTTLLVGIYAIGLEPIGLMLTNQRDVVDMLLDNRIWCIVIPLIGAAAFIWDGIFVGLTRTREMFICTMLASLTFFGVYFLPEYVGGIFSAANGFSQTRLWTSFSMFLLVRGLGLTAFYNIKPPLYQNKES